MNSWRSYGPIDRPSNLDDRVQISGPVNGISKIYDMQGKELGRFATAAQLAPTEPIRRVRWYSRVPWDFVWMTTGILVLLVFSHYLAFSLGRSYQTQREATVGR